MTDRKLNLRWIKNVGAWLAVLVIPLQEVWTTEPTEFRDVVVNPRVSIYRLLASADELDRVEIRTAGYLYVDGEDDFGLVRVVLFASEADAKNGLDINGLSVELSPTSELYKRVAELMKQRKPVLVEISATYRKDYTVAHRLVLEHVSSISIFEEGLTEGAENGPNAQDKD
jgi:hypothetical protein